MSTPSTRRNLIFVHGKGGVGKSAVANAIALSLSQNGAKTLVTAFEDPTREPGELKQLGPKLWQLNADSMLAFEEYAGMKIEKLGGIGSGLPGLGGLSSLGMKGLSKVFTDNKLIRYLAKAAPGIHELVLLGKVWHERNHYDHVVVDMPSTGYGLAMFQSTVNFSKLFGGGPLSRDADAMLESFRDPEQTGHVIVALPEEMPLREGLELNQFLLDLFPVNPAFFVMNRVFPARGSAVSPASWESPFASSMADYSIKRGQLEAHNMRLWKDSGIRFSEIDFFSPSSWTELMEKMSRQMKAREMV